MIGALVALVVLLVSLDPAQADPACALPPSGLDSVLAADGSGIVLTWQASPCNPDRYAIYRRDMDDTGARMRLQASVPGDALTYLDSEVSAGVTYRYRVRSNDQGPRSAWTELAAPVAESEPEDPGVSEEPIREDNSGIQPRSTHPTFDSGLATMIEVSEDTVASTEIGSAYTATDPDGDMLSYHLSGVDAGEFSIDSTTGQLSANPTVGYDYETTTTYMIVVGVRDAATDTADDDTISVTINITNLDELGTVTITGTEVGGETLTASVTDLDGTVTSLTWRWQREGSGDNFSNISGATSSTYTTVAADVGKKLKVVVSYTDPQGSGKSASAETGAIGSSNSDPTFSSMTATRTLPENSGLGANVVGGTITATDNDADTLTYSLTGTHAGRFEVDSNGQIKTKSTGSIQTFNFEGSSNNSFSVTLNVRDSKDNAGDANTVTDDTIAVTINLTDVNEAPNITTSQTTISVAENQTGVLTYAASDVDNNGESSDSSNTLTWSVESADDGGFFEINSSTGVLTFKAAPDFEDKQDAGANNVYNVTVTVTDNGIGGARGSSNHLSVSKSLAVTVTDVNETPTITSGPTTITKDENTATSEVIATYVATDPDATRGTMSWDLLGNDAGDFNIRSTVNGTGELMFKNAPDFENPADTGTNNEYDVTVRVRDNGSPRLQHTRVVGVTVEDVNETPVISGDAVPSFAEIEYDDTSPDLTVGTYTATDDEGDTYSWAVSGTDAAHFSINTSTGVLSFSFNPDFENPADLDDSNMMGASDNMYEIVVEATDDNAQGGKTGTKTGTYAVTVTVTNVDETPEITTTGSEFSAPMFDEIEWDADTADLVVATYQARDEEGEAISWTLSGNDTDDLSIDRNTGVLSFKNRPNFEMPNGTPTNTPDPADNTYEITVQATDASPSPNRREFPVVVEVVNVNERPDIVEDFDAPQTYTEIEYDATDARPEVHTFSAVDYDDGDTFTWSLLGTDAADLDIDSFTGVLTFNQTACQNDHHLPDYEEPCDDNSSNDYKITVRATDDDIVDPKSTDYAVVIEVTNVNERPEFTGSPDSSPSAEEHDANEVYETRTVFDYSARDEEGDVTWTLTGADAGHFAIDSNDGVVTFDFIPSYEDPVDADEDNIYEYTVVATDIDSGSSRLSATHDVELTVTDIEEAGTITVSNLFPSLTTDCDPNNRDDPGSGCIIFTLTDPDGLVDQPEDHEMFQLQLKSTNTDWRDQFSRALNPYFFNPQYHFLNQAVRVTALYLDRRSKEAPNPNPDKTATSEPTNPITTDPTPNAPPRFIGPLTPSVPEGPAGMTLSNRLFGWDQEGDTLTFGIQAGLSDDGDLFEIDAATGEMRLAVASDFETDPLKKWTFTATLHDGKGVDSNNNVINDDTVDVTQVGTVDIADVEEPGVVTLSDYDPALGDEIEAQLTDGDGGVVSEIWQWARSSNGRTGWTNIAGANGDTYTTVPADKGFVLRAQVTYRDRRGGGKEAEAITTAQAFGYNQQPAFPTNEDGRRTVPENTRSRVNIGAPMAAVDPDGDSLVYTLIGPGADAFSIVSSSGQIRTNQALDFEAAASYGFTLQVHDRKDGAGNQSTQVDDELDVIITVENVQEPGTVEFESATGEIQARVPLTAVLEDGDGIVGDGIDGAVTWLWARSPNGRTDWANIANTNNAEYTPDLDVDVGKFLRATASYDDGFGTGQTASGVTSRVGDPPPTNSAPVFPATEDGQRQVAENSSEGTLVGDPVAATDFNNDALTYSLSGTNAALFTVGTNNGQLQVAAGADLDFETKRTLRVTVEVTDGANSLGAPDNDAVDDRQNVTITLTDVNEAPVVSGDASVSVKENMDRVVATYSAADPERDTLTWSVSVSTFRISQQGQLYFRSPPDYEIPTDSDQDRVYEVTVMATDEQGLTAELDVRVTVTDVNEGPEVSRLGSAPVSFPENQAQNTVLASYTATDPEGDPVSRWRTSGTDGGDFIIDEQGELRFRNVPDYERPADSNRNNEYVFTVQVSDGRNYGSFDETVTVTPVNEPPTITTTSKTEFTQPENRTTRLYTYRATDPEGGSTITWAVGGADSRFFFISGRGEFSFAPASPPDFEARSDSNSDNVYEVTIRVSDDSSPPNTESLPVTVTVTDVNEGPEVTRGGDSFSVQENRDWPGASFTASDPEGGSVTRWALGGRDGGDFVISETGVMTFRSVPDYERPADSDRDNVYEVEVRPYDGRYYGSHPVVVTVEDVSEITGPATLNRAENFEGTLGSYSAVGRGDLTVEPKWSLSGTDGGDFTIDGNGQLSFRSVPDYERPADSNRDNTYVFTVRATDDRYHGTLDVTVTVTAVNEHSPVIRSGSRTSFTYREDATSPIYTYSASDGDRDEVIAWTTGGDDGQRFEFTGRNALVFREPPNHEAPTDSGRDNGYNLTVVATDSGGLSDSLEVEITVTDVNEGPEVSGESSFTIQENRYLTNAVYTALDPEGANVARWNVGGRDGGDFFITQGGTLYFRNLPDYERPADSDRDNKYEILIQPSDSRNSGSYPVTVTVTDVDEPPEIGSGSSTSFSQPENRTSRLYSFSATDPEGSAVTWSVGGTDGSHFTIDERGQFSFDENDPPDFDTPGDQGGDNIYNATIQARDPQFNTASLPVAVVVTEVNEGPVITRQGNAPGSVPENHGVDQVLARYTASDPERPSVRITQWSTAGRDGGDFVINALGELRFRNSPDYERPADSNRDNVYELTIRASDGRYTSTLEEIQTVMVTGVNEAPTITTTSRTTFTMQENRTSALYTFRATDPEGGTITWSPTGSDGNAFTMDDRGALSFANPPDYESPTDADQDNVYNVTVQARDPEGNPDTLAVTVTVTDHNEGVEPTISTRRPPSTYRENGTSTVYTFRASDPQRGPIIWAVTGTDSSSFAITPDSSGRGVLTFNGPPDFENPTDADRDNVYELAVVATDGEGHSDRVDFTITVTDHDEGVEPTISTRRPPATYRENDTRTVYTFRASDPQRGPIAWTVTGTDSGAFGITPDSSGRGVLTFNSPPDFESPTDSSRDNVYEIAVVATDDDGYTDRVAFTIAVTNVDEGPQIRLDGTARTSVAENLEQDTVLAKYMATDPENPSANIFRWSTPGRDGGDFVINELGELRFRSSPDFERPADSDRDNVYELMVRASDGRTYGTLEEPLLITVAQVNEAPVITTKSRTEFSLRENSTSNIYTYRATDQDVGDVVSWSVEGPDAGDFAIFDGVLNFRLLPDFEIPANDGEDNVYEITVVAADGAGLRDTRWRRHHHHRPVRGAGDSGPGLPHGHRELRHHPGPGVIHRHRRQGQSPRLSPVVPLRAGRRRLCHRQVQRRPDLPQHTGL